MLTGSMLSQESFVSTSQLLSINLSSIGGALKPDSILGLKCIFYIWIIIISGYLLTGASERLKKFSDRNIKIKPLGEIIKNECREIRQKEVNLAIFSNGIHCMVNKILVYIRAKSGEYIIVLNSDKGCLVETYFDNSPASNEFTFICNVDEAAKEGTPVSISRFNYTLYDRQMEKEINH
jgi:hypothetical protein